MEYDSILIEPVLTEKSNVARDGGRYAFKVDPRADAPGDGGGAPHVQREPDRLQHNQRKVQAEAAPQPPRQDRDLEEGHRQAQPGEKIAIFEGA